MARTFADEIVETSTTQGTVTYQLGGAKGSYRRFRAAYDDGEDKVYYGVRGALKTKWELHRRATLEHGSPDTLTRNVFLSTNGNAAVSWTAEDMPLTIYVPSAADVLEMVITGGLAAARHALIRTGAFFWKYSDVTVSWRRYLAIGDDDGDEIGVGTYVAAKGAYFEDGRRPWTAVGAANKVAAAADIGGVFTFNNSAAERTFTLPAHSDAGVGHGYKVGGLGLTSASGYSIVVTPAAGDGIEGGADGVARRIPGGVRFDVEWDEPTDTWRIIYLNTSPAVALRRQCVQSGPRTAAGLPDFLPASASGNTLTFQNISATTPLVVSAAGGFGLLGPQDRRAVITTAPAISGLSNGTHYIYAEIDAALAVTWSTATLLPEEAATYSTTNGQHTFNKHDMMMKVGNGSTASQVWRVFVGEVVVSGGNIASTVAYAYNGWYESAFTNTLPAAASATSVNHNIGMYPRYADFIIQCISTDGSYAVGDEVSLSNMGSTSTVTTYSVPVLARTAKAISIAVSNSTPWFVVAKTGGPLGGLDGSKWKYKFVADRGWG